MNASTPFLALESYFGMSNVVVDDRDYHSVCSYAVVSDSLPTFSDSHGRGGVDTTFDKTKQLSVGREVYPSDRYRIVRRRCDGYPSDAVDVPPPLVVSHEWGTSEYCSQIGFVPPSFIPFLLPDKRGTYWTHSRSLFLEWNEEVRGILDLSGFDKEFRQGIAGAPLVRSNEWEAMSDSHLRFGPAFIDSHGACLSFRIEAIAAPFPQFRTALTLAPPDSGACTGASRSASCPSKR